MPDIFNAVFKAGPENVTSGRYYQLTLLEKGFSEDEMRILNQLFGGEPDVRLFSLELGVSWVGFLWEPVSRKIQPLAYHALRPEIYSCSFTSISNK